MRVLVAACLVALAASLGAATASSAAGVARPIPVLAYYYIWYDPSSWSRAKTDYPLLGRYSSDDVHVVEQHVKWAQQAGIDGFIVSWKHTPALDARLAKLVRIADRLNFKLAIIYQGLDFYRHPLPVTRIARDLEFFANRFAPEPAFQLYSKPLVIWSGTWQFSAPQIEQVAAAVRDRLLVLASEKSAAGYRRLSGIVDGDAYYWSSVDPQTFPGYPGKLVGMAAAVHEDHGLWIAPAAPGFDARLVGGHIVVPRRNGSTLREELTGAEQSSPDAIGLISWNEFSENSQVEPSRRYGTAYVRLLRDVLGSASPALPDFASDNSAGSSNSYGLGVAGAAGGALLVLVVLVLLRTARTGRGDRRGDPAAEPRLEE